MLRPLLPLIVVLGVLAVAGVARADHVIEEEGAQEAAAASFERMLPDWNVVGLCETTVTPTPNDVCFRFTPGRSTPEYSIYSAFAFGVTDTGWWVGVIEVEGGYKVYDGGRCDLFYCRLSEPDGDVLFGFPAGNVDCDGEADAQDALLILQVVADLLAFAELACSPDADVFPRGGLDTLDALGILQSSAGLIGGLPVIDPELVL